METITKNQIKNYETYLIENEKSELTIDKYLRDLSHFISFAGERQINKFLMLDYKSHLEKEYAIASANSMIASINSFLRFVGLGDFQIRQFKVQKQIYRSEQKELTKAEYFRLCRTAEECGNERLSMILQTICGTGIRISELQFITVEAVKRSETTVSCKNKTRTVFIVRELQKNVEKRRAI